MEKRASSTRPCGWIEILTMVLGVTLFTASCGTSTLSDEEIDDPTSVAALFTVSKVVDEATGEEQVRAGAVFKGERLRTVEFINAEMELEDPQGNIHPLDLQYNRLGSPFYEVELDGDLELGAFYSFRVTLANGRLIVNSIKTPDEALGIVHPAEGDYVDKTADLDVEWTGRSAGKVTITVGPEKPNLFNMLAVGGIRVDDDGRASLTPTHLANVLRGDNTLTIVRSNETAANGFHPSSMIGAVLVNSQDVVIE